MARTARLAFLFVVTGCISPSPPADMRWFRPASSLESVTPPGDARDIGLRPVVSSAWIGERINWRRSEVEVGFYELDRWAEVPALYLERAFERSLSRAGIRAHRRDFGEVVLETELLAFEELRDRAPGAAALVFELVLHGSQGVLLQRTFEVTEPLEAPGPEALALAMGEALRRGADEAAAAVADALSASP